MKKIINGFAVAAILMSSFAYHANAQDSTKADKTNKPITSSATKFLLAGKAQISWTNTMTKMTGSPDVKSNSFYPDAFMLMPLVKVNSRLFLDAQVEVDANPMGGGAAINLVEAIAYYRVANGLSIFAGNFSPKYGLFMGVLDDFTNRYSADPIGMARGPQTQTGIGVQGGIQLGYSKLNYQLYAANGPQMRVDSTTQGNGNLTGQLYYDNYQDNNKNKSIGGSIGFLPFSNSSLQVDLSGQMTGKVGDAGTPFENISSTSIAADMNYYHAFGPVMLRLLAEYNSTTTKKYDYPWHTDTTNTSLVVPGFNNQFSGWFCGATVRLTGAKSKLIKNLELGGRIGGYTPPKYDGTATTPLVSPWGENPEKQTTVCLTYWLTWKTPLNFSYDVLTMTDGPAITTYSARLIYFF